MWVPQLSVVQVPVLVNSSSTTPIPVSFNHSNSDPSLPATARIPVVTNIQIDRRDEPSPFDPVAKNRYEPSPHGAVAPRRLHEARTPEKSALDLDATLDGTFTGTLNAFNQSATVGSLEEFMAGVVSPQRPDPTALATIQELRAEKTDRAIRQKILRLSNTTCESLVVALDLSPALFLELCIKERGNIVSTLIEKLGCETTFCLVRSVLDNFLTIAKSQAGCIALPRVLSHLKKSQLDVFFDATMEAFDELVAHPFGNFVVKHFINSAPQYADFAEVIVAKLCGCPVSTFVRWGTNKHSSQIFDELVKAAPSVKETTRFVRHLFLEIPRDDLKRLAFDPYANYCIQAAFDFLDHRDREELHRECVAAISVVVRDSPYAQNIMKHANRALKRGPPFVSHHHANPTQPQPQQQQQNQNQQQMFVALSSQLQYFPSQP